MQIVRGNPTLAFVNIAAKPITAGLFVVNARSDEAIVGIDMSRKRSVESRFADSESQFLAIKKFSCPPASRLIGARQNRFFARIAAPDSRHDSSSRRSIAVGRSRGDARSRALRRHRIDDSAALSRGVQMPSFDFRRSLTACGLALPPDDFIT